MTKADKNMKTTDKQKTKVILNKNTLKIILMLLKFESLLWCGHKVPMQEMKLFMCRMHHWVTLEVDVY